MGIVGTTIIAGFVGIGKTTLANKYKNVLDLESSVYRWDNTNCKDISLEKRKGTKRKTIIVSKLYS